MGRVIYLTGAPATGKSSLCANIQQRAAKLLVYSYSALLQDHIRQRDGADIGAVELREKSSRVVTREDVMAVDARLIDEVNAKCSTHDILIDSHPVTKESYGFRVTPFRADQVSAFSPDAIVCLYASPETLHQRISMNPDGRTLPSMFEIEMHTHIQAALATQYSVIVGRSCYLIDSSVPPQELVETIWPIFGFVPR